MNVPDVLIVGGGVIGLTTAYYLARDGVRVTLVDSGEIGRQASWAGAGILTPGDSAFAQTPMDQLRTHSFKLYPQLSAALRDETGLENGYCVCGGIELPETEATRDQLPTEEWHSPGAKVEFMSHWVLRETTNGLITTGSFAAYLPEMAQVRNPWHLRALQAGCERHGVTIMTHWPVRRVSGDGVVGERGRLAAGRVVVAGGAWAGQLLASLGVSLPIRPVRGQMLQVRLNSVPRPIVLKGKRYIVPREDGVTLIGSTEEDAGFDPSNTKEGIGGLLAFAESVNPLLGGLPLEKTWAGLRPGTVDGLPYLGAVPDRPRLYVAAGHFRAGLQLSPGTGLAMAQLLTDRRPFVPLEAFGLGR